MSSDRAGGPAGNPPRGDPALERLLEAFSARPTDRRAFGSVEEALYLAGDWARLAGVYEARLDVLDRAAPVWAEIAQRLALLWDERLGEPDAARKVYEQILRAKPGDPQALASLRQLHTRRGALTAALQIAEVEEGLRLPPFERARVLGEVGELWRDIGEETEAQIRFAEALQLDPCCEAALAGSAALAESRGDGEQALGFHQRRLEVLVGSARSEVLEHMAVLAHGDPARARALLREAIRECPDRRSAIDRLLEVERERGAWARVDELQRTLFGTLREPEEQLALCIEAAEQQLANGEPDAALDWLDRVDRVEVRALRLRVRICRRTGRTDRLIGALERLAEAEPATPMLALEIAALHEREGRIDAAVDWLRRHLENEPEDPEALAVLDRCLERGGRASDRVEVLERRAAAASSDEERVERLVELGDAARAAEDPDAAEAAYRRALTDDPSCVPATERLEQLLRKQGRGQDLVRLLEEVAARTTGGPRAARVWATLGSARLDALDDPLGAREAFLRALEIAPDEDVALAGLRRAAECDGRADWLIEACDRELACDPTQDRRAELLERLVVACRHSGDIARARRAAESWSECAADHAPLRALVEIARDQGDPDREWGALERLREFVQDPAERAAVLARLGDLALQRDDTGALEAAISHYREAVQVAPVAPLRRRLIQLCRDAGDLPAAVIELDALLSQLPEEEQAGVRIELSRALAELGDLARATDALAPAVARDPGLPEGANLLEALLEEQDRFDELTDQLARRLARERDPVRRRKLGHRLSEVYLESLGRPADAVAALRELADPTRGSRLEQLFERALEAAGETEELLGWLRLRELHISDAERVDLLVRLAGVQESDRRVGDAVATLRRAEQAAPLERRGVVRAPMLRLFRQLGKLEDQLELLERSLNDSIDPDERCAVRVERARLLAEELERPEDAVRELVSADLEGRLSVDGLRLLVALYSKTGDSAARIEALERLAREEPGDAERERALVELSNLLLSGPATERNSDRAERALLALRDLCPDSPEPFEQLAGLYEASRRHAELERLLARRLEEASPGPEERVSLALRLARLRVDLGETERAVAVLRDMRGAADPNASGVGANAAVAELLLECLCALGDRPSRLELCAECARASDGPTRRIWFERWLEALAESDADADAQLAVISELGTAAQLDREMLERRLALLRAVEHPVELAETLEALTDDAKGLDRGQRARRLAELLDLYAGPLNDPERGLALAERELALCAREPDDSDARLVQVLRCRALELAERVGEPAREVALLEPLVGVGAETEPRLLRRLALLQAQSGQPSRALPLLRRALEAHPRDVEVARALVRELRTSGPASELGPVLELQFPLEDRDTQLEIAREGFECAQRESDDPAALRWLRRAQQLEPLDDARSRQWVRLERELGAPAQRLQSLRCYTESSSSAEERAPLWAEQGRLHRERGDLESARSAYARALEDSHEPRAEWLEAYDGVLERLGRSDERMEVLAALARHKDRSALERAKVQQTYVELLVSQPGMRSVAARELEEFLAADPAVDGRVQAERMRRLLAVYAELERPIEWCALAEQLLPILPEAERRPLQRELARRLGPSLGARERAVNAWREVLEDEPDDAEALDALAELHRVPGQERSLADVLERRSAGHPEGARLLAEAAALYWGQLGDAAAALRDLDRALERDPELRRAHELRVELAHRLGRADQEVASLRALLERPSGAATDAERWARLAELLAEQGAGDAPEAGQAAERVLELAPDHPRLRESARRVFERVGRFERVVELLSLEIATAQGDGTGDLLRRLAEISWDELRRADATCSALAQLAELEPTRPEDDERWAEALAERGSWTEALARRRDALTKLGSAAGAQRWRTLAKDILERTGNAEAAREACDGALMCDSACIEALFDRIDLDHQLGDAAREAEDAAHLGELLPGGPRAAECFSRAAAVTRNQLGDPQKATALYRAALKSHPNDVAALIGGGELALDREQWAEAERMLSQACGLISGGEDSGELAHASRLAAEASLARGRHADALRHLETALRCEPDHAGALDRMTEVALELSAYGSACEALEHRLALGNLDSGDRAQRLVALAKAWEARDEPERAIRALESALDLRPDRDDARAHLIELLEQTGELRSALTHLERSLERVPDAERVDLAVKAARFEARLGEQGAARARLQALADRDQLSEEGWRELAGWVLEDAGPEEALAVTALALERVEGRYSRGILLWLEARALEALERHSEAVERACAVLDLTPANLEAAHLLAERMGYASSWPQAVEAIERAISQGRPEETREAQLQEALGRAYAGPLENMPAAQKAYRRALECNPARDGAREALADCTAFDPLTHSESLELHRVLLEEFPGRCESWRALSRIAEHRRKRNVVSTCAQVLSVLGGGPHDPNAASGAPEIDADPAKRPEVGAAVEFLRVLHEVDALPEGFRGASFRELPAILQADLGPLVGAAWQLEDEPLGALLAQASDDEDARFEGLPRRARRRLRQAFRRADAALVRELSPQEWRSEVLAQAAATAVRAGRLSVAEALLGLLRGWPETAELDLEPASRVGPAAQICPPARRLLLRISGACLRVLGA